MYYVYQKAEDLSAAIGGPYFEVENHSGVGYKQLARNTRSTIR